MEVQTVASTHTTWFGVARAIAIAFAVLVGCASADAAVAPNGKIAYVVCEYSVVTGSDTCDIWVMNPDGTGQTNITNTPDINESNPVWSPDSLKIAFNSGDTIYFSDIWIMNADGSGRTNVTQNPSYQFGPTWSATGDKLAFVRNVPGITITSQFDIFVINVDGTGLTNITDSDYDELDPAWAPSGLRIAFAAVRMTEPGGGGDWEIVTVNTDGTAEINLTAATGGTQEDRAPTWSPDSTMVAFMSEYDAICCGDWEIWAVNADGTGITNLTNLPTAADWYPSWSPDGTLITFSSNRDALFGGQFDIYSIAAPTVLPPPPPLQRAASVATTPAPATRLTTSGNCGDPSWGRVPAGHASTPGVSVDSTGAWFLRNSMSAGNADYVFTYGVGGANTVKLGGDWDGNGTCTPGLYDPSTGVFFLKNSNSSGPADLTFSFGAGNAGYIPIVGDWNGDGVDSIGLYQPLTGAFFLRNSNTSGPADVTFAYGAPAAGLVPIAGDWNADGLDTIGLYAGSSGAFFLRNSNTSGAADLMFTYGGTNRKPIAGDWDGDGRDTIGVYDAATAGWFVRNSNSPGAASAVFGYGPPNSSPVTGDWDGN